MMQSLLHDLDISHGMTSEWLMKVVCDHGGGGEEDCAGFCHPGGDVIWLGH